MSSSPASHSLELLAVARSLVQASTEPGDAYLRRAQSSVYYALFHCLAHECADTMIGTDVMGRSNKAWHQVYRALEHGQAAKRCEDSKFAQVFPQELQDFAFQFRTFLWKREAADYDVSSSPLLAFGVSGDIELAETALTVFREVSEKDRRAFCAYVLIKQRPVQSPPRRPAGSS